MRRFGLILLGGLAGTAVACGGGGDGGNGPGTITSVVVSGDSTVIVAGTRQLTATALSGSTPVSTGVTFQWSSSDTTRATVSASGLVTGVRLGSTSIRAIAVLNGTPTTTQSSPHAIRSRIGSIFINPGDHSINAFGAAALMRAQARDAQSAAVPGVTFTWISRAPSVVSVTAHPDSSHLANLLATANGVARIVVTGDGVSDSITATVHQEATSLGLTPISFNFDRINRGDSISVVALDGHSFPLDDSLITWSSRNTGVATVNTTGISNKRVIRSVNDGQTRVVARAGALGDSVDVTVNLIYSSVQITTSGPLPTPLDSALIFRLNGSLQLGMIVRDVGNTIVPNPQNFAWSLKHPGTIATIGTTTGLVTGNSTAGTDTIVLVARGIPDTVPLVVRQVLASINVTPASPAALNFVGDTQTFAAEPRDSGGAAIPGQTITWATNNAVLDIDASGLATAIQRTSAAGVVVKVKATVGAFTDSSRSIVVKQVPASANLDPNSFGTLTAFGRQASASCVVLDSAADTIPNHLCTWSAGTAGVVSFSPTTAKTTTVTAIGNGSTTIQAQAAPTLFGFNSITVDQIPATIRISPANFGTPDVLMRTSQTAPFFAAVLDSLGNADVEDSVTWSTNNAPVADIAATATLDSTIVTTFASAGTATITATAAPASASRIVNVSTTPISFATAVAGAVFQGAPNCDGCHPPNAGMNLTAGSAFANIVGVASTESPLRRVRPFRPDSSYLVHKIQGTQSSVGGSGSRMPLGCSGLSCLPDATINTIRNWILQGALNN
jgi:hypothetical protein